MRGVARARGMRQGLASAAAVAALAAGSATGGAGRAEDEARAWVAQLSSPDAIEREIARRRLFAHRAIDALAEGLDGGGERAAELAARLELLALIDPDRIEPRIPGLLRHANGSVRVAAAHALGRAATWPSDAIATAAADPDDGVPRALLEGAAALSPARRLELARRLSPRLGDLLERGDPQLRRLAIDLLALDDSPASAALAVGFLARATDAERTRLWHAIAVRPPRWDPELLAAIARDSRARAAGAEPEARALSWRLAIGLDPDARPALDDETLIEAWRSASGPPGAGQEHAAAMMLALGPEVSRRLRELWPRFLGDEGLERALELWLRWDGEGAVERLARALATGAAAGDDARAILSLLARLPCEEIARRLDEDVAPALAPVLRPALAETALRMPECEARTRLLLDALRDLRGDARLRPFEALARSGNSALLGFLLDALEGESDGRVRGRMIGQIGESFGGSDPDDVLALLRELFASARAGDRVAALEAVPFVALGGQMEAVATEIARRFAHDEPEALLHVLAQIGGASAESCFTELAGALAPDPEREGAYRFLIARCGRLRGEPTLRVIARACDDERPRIVEAALRALLERGEPSALESVPRLLVRLEPGARAPLAADLGSLRHLSGYAPMVARLLAQADERAVRLALLELAEPALRDVLLPESLALLESGELDERLAAIEALGRLGGDDAVARLERSIEGALALPDERFRESEPGFAEGRAALLALRGADPARAAARAATMLLRLEAARADERVARAALALPADPPLADPALVEALAGAPGGVAIAALDDSWSRLGERADRCDERFFSECAQIAWRLGADPRACEWFDRVVLRLWPPDTAADFRALLPPGPRREALRRLALDELDPALLADVEAISAALARGEVSPRLRAEALGRRDALLGLAPERTLAVVSALAQGAADGPEPVRAAAIEAAAREARDCPPLLQALAARARRDGVPCDDLERLARHPAPADAELAAVLRALRGDR